MKVYFISGLAADKRVFKYISLPTGCEAVHLDWITPQKDDTLPSYALRLASAINRDEPFALVGLSFGGNAGNGDCQTIQTCSNHSYIQCAGCKTITRLFSYGR